VSNAHLDPSSSEGVQCLDRELKEEGAEMKEVAGTNAPDGHEERERRNDLNAELAENAEQVFKNKIRGLRELCV
jgi:hypothetical protein